MTLCTRVSLSVSGALYLLAFAVQPRAPIDGDRTRIANRASLVKGRSKWKEVAAADRRSMREGSTRQQHCHSIRPPICHRPFSLRLSATLCSPAGQPPAQTDSPLATVDLHVHMHCLPLVARASKEWPASPAASAHSPTSLRPRDVKCVALSA